MGTGLTSAFGMIPSTDAKDFQARLENLKSQVFLPTVKAMQGMGALSNAEGEKIAAAVANLDPKIGPDAMRQQLSIIARQMANAAQKSKQQTLNYASRGGTIPLNTQNHSSKMVMGKYLVERWCKNILDKRVCLLKTLLRRFNNRVEVCNKFDYSFFIKVEKE